VHQSINLTANQIHEFFDVGDFFRLMAATTNNVHIKFFKNHKEISDAVGVGAGYAEKFTSQNFDKFQIKSPTAQTVTVATRQGSEVLYDLPPTGQVNVTNTTGFFAETQNYGHYLTTVTNVNSSIDAAGPRKYLLIQNKGLGDIYIRVDGWPATFEAGIKIEPGGSIEFPNKAPNNLITAIGSIERNPNILIVKS
jgi:hypothetical protein